MIEANKFKLGIFVISAGILFLAAVFVFGLADIFKQSMSVFSVFSDSVQGLSVGSPVKFKGVPVGQVKKILIRGEDEYILIFMELDLTVFHQGSKGSSFGSDEFERFFNEQLKRGLTCGLELAGITGMKYVELDYATNNNIKIIPRPQGIKSYYIPSRPSVIQNIIKMINQSLSSIADMKLGDLSKEITNVLKGADKLINNPKLESSIDNLEELAATVNKTVSELLKDPRLKQAVERFDSIMAGLDKGVGNFNSALSKERINALYETLHTDLDSFDKLMKNLNEQVNSMKMSQTSAAIRASAEAVSEGKIGVLMTLQRLNRTLEALTELINYIDDDPSSLIKGKQKKPLTGSNGKILPQYTKE